ncbi:MAG: alpha-hydroxy acid oxidase [Acidimicrobiia bacterium]|nr:alpha-hydroxy acid oxidase [Acidimicrobiia bacterium]
MTDELVDMVSIDQIVALARERIEPGPFTWADAAAGEEVTAARNRKSLANLALVPQMFTDVGTVDTTSSFVGVPLSMPVMLAPVGAMSLYHEDGALGCARAAAAAGTSGMCGMLVSEPWEALADTAPGRHFFQLYVCGDRTWLTEVIQRVETAGFAGIVVTADTPVIGRRDRALTSGFRWTRDSEDPYNLARHGFDMDFRKRVTWSDFEFICETASIPVVLKGVMSAGDASHAVDAGAAGVYVSNHGGRALDHVVSTIEVLAEVVEAVSPTIDVVVDSGFMRGPDVCKALARGATAVGLGRLQCWALGAGGQAGVERTLQILREEIETSMANLGVARVADLGAEHVRWSTPVN